ncbi:hypothetical protein FB451DRAFT_1391234 [Mycena latifolia]|nr:hypothetical protein FB451DRAFT_1391234 [Mycena latifolia]
MADPTSTTTVFGIQELCDQISHHIALYDPSQATLKSAALVSQTLCIAAQSQIFRHVDLDVWRIFGVARTGADYPALDAAPSAFRGLFAVLAASPHLLRYIRSLSVPTHSRILEWVLGMELSLQKIRLNFMSTKSTDVDALRLARDCIGLPSIRKVELVNVHLPLDRIAFLFESCGSNLDSLSFSCVDPYWDLSNGPVLHSTERRAQIRKLKLFYVSGAPLQDWLFSSALPFDFTHLTTVKTDRGKTASQVQLLASTPSTIRRLCITGSKLPVHPLTYSR